ncbi:NADH-quinone oxidoreductase subunit NuoG [Rubellimicrobium aerolatum]|uniref:NADH-quinone oxidoreductase n=1 Tax=Rubellimicrobium aerolatum TaxID=490979 RepID=A0ABW0SBW3_9RHOB|nr:NADH-quinone oxidoreductase subunit NuoG [Rubellimicrobium aerolatum]MBP1805882.1 NADH-quinone oxidoreductase subunit G [Rubellimicrobium aerolatum]
MPDLKPIMIDGTVYEVPAAMTILQACDMVGIEIPRFCYHERLSIAGNCRMCLVEVVGGPPKPTASCAQQVKDLRPGKDGQPPEVKTNSPMVKKARAGVMEFLLINHPLDCPICDQGGECDLQDQALAYGLSYSRYREPKRATEDLDLGPLVETHMNRCISCTRCVRFTTEIAGITQMGQTGRGEDSEITSYLNQTLSSNLQGNIIDLCPVGALVSKPYAYKGRPWELVKTDSIDVMDALGSSIRVDSKGREVMRILPRNHDGVNEEWLSDKARFVWDGLRRQRLDTPYVREGGRLRKATWTEALSVAARALRSGRVAGLVGDLAPTEAAFALKDLMARVGGTVECRVDGARLYTALRGGYAGNARIEDLATAKRIVIVGSNPRVEAPVLNARIRGAWLKGAEVTVIGETADLTYDYAHAGTDRAALDAFREGAAPSENAVVILGQGALREADGEAVLSHVLGIVEAMGAKLLVLHTAASRVGALDVGCVTEGGMPAAVEGAEVIWNLGADEIEIARDQNGGPFVIYQGSHGDRGAHRADLILPAAAWTEENGLFVNTEGRPQLSLRAGFAPGEAKENWAILRAVSGALGSAQPWDSLAQLRQAMVAAHPHLAEIDSVPANRLPHLAPRKMGEATFRNALRDYFLTNPIARASQVMGELSALEAQRNQTPRLAAE